MKTKYFNEFEFKKALELVDTNPFLAKIKFEDYLDNYPNDYSAYPYYISCLVILGNFDEAEKYMTYLKKLEYTNDNFKYLIEKRKKLKNNIIFTQLKLLSYQHKYNEMYNLCKNNFSVIIDLNMKSVFFYCRKKIGELEGCLKDENSYLYRQIIDYTDEDFLDHIQKHLADFNKDSDNPSSSIFSYDFPISEVIEEIKKIIPSSKRLFTGFYEDSYVFKYDYCGKENNKVTNYFKVFCFHDTNNIITMCPSLNCEHLPYIDLNYLNQSKNSESGKVRKLSQIDKFNQRYKLN